MKRISRTKGSAAKRAFGLFMFCVSLSGFAVADDIGAKVIYGKDNRKDIYDTDSALYRDLAQSTVALFNNTDVIPDNGKKTAKLVTENFGDSFSLCKDEPFRDQPSGAFCSGSLVADDMVLTAGHCIRSASACAGVKFVFGFGIRQKGNIPTEVGLDDVYSCTKIVAREEQGYGADFALVKIDRKVTKYKPLAISRRGDPDVGAEMVVIGHLSGIPTKVSDGANVRSNENGYFVANIHMYGGNSGSAVFNTKTGLVEGVRVRGETDFVNRNGCYISNVCPSDGCRGEDVTKISAVAKYIP